jgi:hypothetical protein
MRAEQVVVGLHPDGATDAIVEFALERGKPFAILPCCVYRKHFPHRRILVVDHIGGEGAAEQQGRPVRSYEDLLDYLQGLDPGVRRATLDFAGRNVVLYHLGRRASQPAGAAGSGSGSPASPTPAPAPAPAMAEAGAAAGGAC